MFREISNAVGDLLCASGSLTSLFYLLWHHCGGIYILSACKYLPGMIHASGRGGCGVVIPHFCLRVHERKREKKQTQMAVLSLHTAKTEEAACYLACVGEEGRRREDEEEGVRNG